MAIYVFQMKTFSRAAGHRGSRSTSAAAYRAGERIHDQRTGATYDHRGRQDVLHKEIMLSEALERSGASLNWARSRATLWNAAEHAETRRNSRVAREFMVALPHELPAGDRITLARGFARELVERYDIAVDLAVHAPRTDERNFHAHLLATTRVVTREGLGRKADLELSGTERYRRGLLRWAEERAWLRERWAAHTNQALQAAHLDVRVSHEYPAMRDPSRMPRLPAMAYHIERQGGHSVVAERLRERHRAEFAQKQARASPSAMLDGGRARWLESVRERARSAWLAIRQRLTVEPAVAQPATQSTIRNPDQQPSAPKSQPRVASASTEHSATRELASRPEHSPPAQQQQSSPAHPSIEEMQRASLERWNAYRRAREAHPELPEPELQPDTAPRHEPRPVRRPEVSHTHDYDLGL